MIKPYLLRTPPYDPISGGIKVMYGLYGHLLAKGLPAFLNTQIDTPSIGVYPEIYHGNDMFADKVVRYILQTPGVMGTSDETGEFRNGPTAFGPKDEIYVFSRVYDEWDVKVTHVLFLPIIDLFTFKDMGLKRSKTAFYVGKGVNLGKHPEGSIEITRDFARDQEALAKLLNGCKALYIYDRLSAMMEVARLCGCPVRYYGELTKDKLFLYEPGMNGVSYKDDDEVPLDIKGFRNHYSKELVRTFKDNLNEFIESTQE